MDVQLNVSSNVWTNFLQYILKKKHFIIHYCDDDFVTTVHTKLTCYIEWYASVSSPLWNYTDLRTFAAI